MAKFNEFCQLISNFDDVADFLTIYIEEAHPEDGWAFKDNIRIAQHKLLKDRIAAAEGLMQHNSKSTVVVDNMNNDACFAYGGLFERLYVVHEGRVVYEGKRGPQGYILEEVKHWLVQYTGRYQPNANGASTAAQKADRSSLSAQPS